MASDGTTVDTHILRTWVIAAVASGVSAVAVLDIRQRAVMREGWESASRMVMRAPMEIPIKIAFLIPSWSYILGINQVPSEHFKRV